MNIEQLLKSLLNTTECSLKENGRYTEEIEIEITIETKTITDFLVMNNVKN